MDTMRERFAAVATDLLDHDPRLAVVLADIGTAPFAPAAARHPEAFGHLLQAIDFHVATVQEVALVAPGNDSDGSGSLAELARVVRSGHRPHVVLAGGPEGSERPELLRERPAVDGKAAAYVCEHFTCKAPVTEPEELEAALG